MKFLREVYDILGDVLPIFSPAIIAMMVLNLILSFYAR